MKTSKTYILLLIVVALLVIPAGIGYVRIERIRDSYSSHIARENSQTEGTKNAVAALSDQSNTFTTWAVGLLVWIGGVAFVTELRRIPNRSLVLLFLPLAAGLVLASVWAGIIFDARFSYLALNEALGGDEPLNNLLIEQRNFLFFSMIPIGITTVVFFLHLLLLRRQDEK